MSDYRLILKVVGVATMTFVFWHFWAVWGLVMGLGMALIMVP